MKRKLMLVLLVAAVVVGVRLFTARIPAAGSAAIPQDYPQHIRQWQQEREREIREQWLPLAGLYWLRKGENRMGSGQENRIVLPSGPADGGLLELQEGVATVRVPGNWQMKADGRPVGVARLQPDTSGNPTVLTMGSLTMWLVRRDDKYALRVRDERSERLAGFQGLMFYPVSPEYRVKARFERWPQPKILLVPDVTGQMRQMKSMGYVAFRLKDEELKLEALQSAPPDQELFLIFKDETSGKQTYPAGRYLYSEVPSGEQVILDFNRAYNPPCAFTPYATCPLPPKGNSMPVAVEAGEMYAHVPEAAD